MPTARIGDLDIYYEIHGAGRPLLLVAGLASDSQSWGPLVAALAARCRVIVFDNRGVGRTTPQDAPTGITRMADDAVGLARYLGLEKFSVLGHSMGGCIALDLAIRYPECVEKLVVAAAAAKDSARNGSLFADRAADRLAGMDPDRWFRNFFYWIFTAGFFEDTEAVANAVRLAVDYPHPQGPEAYVGQVRALADFDCGARVSAIRAPTLVLAGREDLLFPPEVCARLAQAIPGAKLAVIERAAHAIFLENTQDSAAAVLDFLAGD
jgi:pimeloyl-ACP methyl ester carboxylesterase